MVLLFLLISCNVSDDSIIQKEYILPNYSVAYINLISDITLVQDTCYEMIFKGTQRNLDNFEFEIRDDTLFVSNLRKMLFRIEDIPAISLHFINLRSLVTYKPATVHNKDTLHLGYFYFYPIGEIGEASLIVNCETFGLDNSANSLGHFYVRGLAGNVYLFNRYGCSIFTDSLLCREAQVINESIGDVYINASENLRVYLWGTGNIYYYGEPNIQLIEKRNTGRIIHLK